GHYSFPAPTYLYEFDPTSNANPYTRLDMLPGFPTELKTVLGGENAFLTRMLVVPNGHILFSTYYSVANGPGTRTQIWDYDPNVAAADIDPAWRPQVAANGIAHLSVDPSNVYTLTGTQLTGISEGAAYGDDAEMSTNYPIVKLT